MKDDYTTNSHYLTYTFLLVKGWENVLFEFGSERVKRQGESYPHTTCCFHPECWMLLNFGVTLVFIDRWRNPGNTWFSARANSTWTAPCTTCARCTPRSVRAPLAVRFQGKYFLGSDWSEANSAEGCGGGGEIAARASWQSSTERSSRENEREPLCV